MQFVAVLRISWIFFRVSEHTPKSWVFCSLCLDWLLFLLKNGIEQVIFLLRILQIKSHSICLRFEHVTVWLPSGAISRFPVSFYHHLSCLLMVFGNHSYYGACFMVVLIFWRICICWWCPVFLTWGATFDSLLACNCWCVLEVGLSLLKVWFSVGIILGIVSCMKASVVGWVMQDSLGRGLFTSRLWAHNRLG